VLPILHLNGYKIDNPAVLARIPQDELEALLRGYGYEPRFVEGDDPFAMHQRMAAALDALLDQIRQIQRDARREADRMHMAVPPGALGGAGEQGGAFEATRTMDEELSTSGTLRRRRPPAG
jgi:xylulose-5-phosphate/fructose-6-phosphate phosphoketolase